METSNYSAQYGKLAGGVMSIALKSGTNLLHGTLFEFVRNDMFDARNFFSQQKSELRRNQFGGTLGGPVVLPKVYNGRDRTFFFFTWESYRQVQGNTQLSVVPTALERTGNFSQSLHRNQNPCPAEGSTGDRLLHHNQPGCLFSGQYHSSEPDQPDCREDHAVLSRGEFAGAGQ